MKKLVTSLLFWFFTVVVFAQNKAISVVYFKNGGVVKGEILEQKPGKEIKVKTKDGNIFVFKMDEVEKIEQNERIKKTTNNKNSGLIKYNGILTIGYQFSANDYLWYNLDRLKFDIIQGAEFNKIISVGLGTGLRYYGSYDVNQLLMPIFLNIRSTVFKTKLSPFTKIGFGYSINLTEGIGEGIIINPSVGVNYLLTERASIFFSIDYELQKIQITNYDYFYNYYYTYVHNADAIGINFGFSF
ncbi:MAG: hypothetical protein Kow0079_08200 [Vicingaceae bacterium]